jgi:ketopantoate reductase
VSELTGATAAAKLDVTMRIAVMGSGGLGGYFGALLARGGADVTFIARGPVDLVMVCAKLWDTDVETPLNRAVADILAVHAEPAERERS